jgi:NADH-quinone oxidoreductase subunit C
MKQKKEMILVFKNSVRKIHTVVSTNSLKKSINLRTISFLKNSFILNFDDFNIVAKIIKNNFLCLYYKTLADIICTDYLELKNRFELIFNLNSFFFNNHFFIFVKNDEMTAVLSKVSCFKSANWQEREVFDLFGVFFLNHNDLRRILTDYGFKGHPLRKDFPLGGYLSLSYIFANKSVGYHKNINI